MTINQLLHRYQLATTNAASARSAEERNSHFDQVSHYAMRIRAWRQQEGLPDTGWPGSAIEPEWARD